MPRKGRQLEGWGEEMIRGTPTKNSGATHEDADMKVDGVGGRLYEFKSSEGTGGISIRRDHAITLLQRGMKLSRDPVFIFQNKHKKVFALMPFPVLDKRMKEFDAHQYQPDYVLAIKHAFQTLPIINAKGNNIRIKEDELELAMEHVGMMGYRTKNTITWIVMEATAWLKFAGDEKRIENDQPANRAPTS